MTETMRGEGPARYHTIQLPSDILVVGMIALRYFLTSSGTPAQFTCCPLCVDTHLPTRTMAGLFYRTS